MTIDLGDLQHGQVIDDTPTRPPREVEQPPPLRFIALDLARFTAITGMIACHLVDTGDPAVLGLVLGPPSTLFAVLGGASAVLATRSREERFGRRAAAVGLVVRGLLVMVCGLLLAPLPGTPNVVLVPLGATLALLPLFLPASTRALVVTTLLLSVAAPVARVLAQPVLLEQGTGGLSLTSPATFLQSLLLTGEYPVATWSVYALTGVLVARGLLRATRRGSVRSFGLTLALSGAAVGALAWVTGWWWALGGGSPGVPDAVLSAWAHSGTTGDIARTTGIALAVLGTTVVLAAGGRVRATSAVLRVVIAAGGASLTIYVLHITALAIAAAVNGRPSAGGHLASPWWLQGAGAFLLHLGAALLVGAVLSRLGHRGPLESWVTSTSDRAAAAVAAARRLP